MNQNQSQCKIYSRNRFKILKPKKYGKINNKNSKFIVFYFEIILVSVFTFVTIYKSIDPIFEAACSDEAKAIATKITNDNSSIVIKNYNYDDLFSIQRDESREYTNDKSKRIYNRFANLRYSITYTKGFR